MRNLVLATFLSIFLGTTTAQAGVAFAYSVDGSIPTTSDSISITRSVGDVVDISVFLIDEAPMTQIEQFGIVAAGYRANFNAGLGDVTGSQIGPGLFLPPPMNIIDNVGGSLTVGVGDDFLVPGTPGVGTGFVELNTFQYRLDSQGTTIFSLVDPNAAPSVVNNSLFDFPNFTNLDPTVFAAPPTLTISTGSAAVVPTPSSMACLGCLTLLGVVRRRRNYGMRITSS